MKKIILVTFFCYCSLLAQFQGFQTTFTFSEFSINTQDLILGYDPFGSDSLDPNLGEAIVSQVPPGYFGVRCQLPSDTSLYTLKDIRFGCGQPFYYEYLVDLSYDIGVMDVDWEWSWQLWIIKFINPYDGETLATFEAYFDSSFYEFLTLDKIIIGVQYNGPLSWPEYDLTSPNGGEVIEGGEVYTITWSSNHLVPYMDIEFSSDEGETWSYVIQNLSTNQNSYNWNVPSISSEHCLMRIGNYPCAFDNSLGTFVTYVNNPPTLNPVEIPFWITNIVNDSINLIAAMHPSATNGLDTSLGEIEIQFPPPGNFDAAMVINNNILSPKDYRPGYSIYIGEKIYYFKVQPQIDSIVYFKMNVPFGVTPSLLFLKAGTGTIGFRDTTFYTNEISYQFPPRTYYGGYPNWFPGIQLTLSFDGSIPVELINFTASTFKDNVTLNWSTATETNNQGFEIQKKKSEVRSQESEWEKIGSVEGHGTTTEPQFYSFTDESLQPGKYQYRLKQIDFDGGFEYSKVIEVTVQGPTEFSLSQNYPNPFNPTTSLQYSVGSRQIVTLKVYDLLGNEIATIVNEEKVAGEYEVEFDGTNLPSGIYFYQMKAANFIDSKKMVLMK